MKSRAAFLLFGLLFCFAVCPSVPAAEEISAAPTATVAPAPSIAPNADPATATRAWLDTVPADKRAKSDAYFEGGYWLLNRRPTLLACRPEPYRARRGSP